MVLTECDGYKRLLAAVEKDEAGDRRIKSLKGRYFHDYRTKLQWIVDRAQHYAEKTGLEASAILDAWEKDRRYWYMNYYQDCNQPEIKAEKVRVFETPEEARASFAGAGFRCPRCNGVSKHPTTCDTGIEIEPHKPCDWKAWGLFGALGKGVAVFVKSEVRIYLVFMPVAWEGVVETASTAPAERTE